MWAGNVSLDEFNNSLAAKYMTILASKDSKIVSGGAANETIKAYFNPVRQILNTLSKMIIVIDCSVLTLILVELADHQKNTEILLKMS